MGFRTSGAIGALLIGLAAPSSQAFAQYYPPAQAYPPPQGYTPPYRPLPPVNVDDETPFYDPPMVQSQQLPPPPFVGPQVGDPRFGRRGRANVEEAELPPPGLPGSIARDVPPNLEPVEPGGRVMRPYNAIPPVAATPPAYGAQPVAPTSPAYGALPSAPPPGAQSPQAPQGFEPAAAGSRPYYPPPASAAIQPAPEEPEGLRPPLPIGPPPLFGPGPFGPGPFGPPAVAAPGRVDPGAGNTGSVAALPPEVRPETGPVKELPAKFRRTLVDYRTKEPAGTIIIDTPNTYLYFVLGDGKAVRYGVGVGREGFTWTGAEKVTRMAEWPDWHPPEEMIDRQPYLPRFMAGGPGNPLGARALYLGKTVYRIHGTNQPSTIGTFVSSGCIRLTNDDVSDLYTRVKVGTRVVVLPGGAPPATAAMPIGPYGAAQQNSPYGPAPSAPYGAVSGPYGAAQGGPPPASIAPLPPPSAMAR